MVGILLVKNGDTTLASSGIDSFARRIVENIVAVADCLFRVAVPTNGVPCLPGIVSAGLLKSECFFMSGSFELNALQGIVES